MDEIFGKPRTQPVPPISKKIWITVAFELFRVTFGPRYEFTQVLFHQYQRECKEVDLFQRTSLEELRTIPELFPMTQPAHLCFAKLINEIALDLDPVAPGIGRYGPLKPATPQKSDQFRGGHAERGSPFPLHPAANALPPARPNDSYYRDLILYFPSPDTEKRLIDLLGGIRKR
eukprot:TRINITY_DN8194_c0_g2_i1.p1 TRINITY_DN8194_c0_g2~~TRINITY_DN8194_c0_g2_i1.p1  ORF type:complete len:174 (-),score=26.06 TRINITY_DN8194_c0_g2_i1:427-948(-)